METTKIMDFLNKHKFLYFLILLTVIFICRLPTFFNDYYDGDILAAILQTKEYLAGSNHFAWSKKPFFHAIFNFSYLLSPLHGWLFVRLFTILFVFLTSIALYFCGKEIKNSETGIIASFLYGILISSFNKNFMASNGEIFYSLPIAWGFLFFILFLKNKNFYRWFFLAFAVILSTIAYYFKVHGLILFLFMIFFLFICLPIIKAKKKWQPLLIISSILAGSLIILYFLYSQKYQPVMSAYQKISNLFYYAAAPERNFTFIDYLVRFLHKQGMLSLWHFIAWIPAYIYIFNFFKDKKYNKNIPLTATIFFFIICWLLVWGGGARLYFHYFMTCYTSLSLIAAIYLTSEKKLASKLKKQLSICLLIPALFFFCWNSVDDIIKHSAPERFYNEGKVGYWTRAILLGQDNGYLLPAPEYKDVILYLQKNAIANQDKLFLWGHGPQIHYFANLRMANSSVWLKNFLYPLTYLHNNKSQSAINESNSIQGNIMWQLTSQEPDWFIDSSAGNMSGFHVKLEFAPRIKKYVEQNYQEVAVVQGMKIYKRRN